MDLVRERGDILVIVTGDHETGGLQIGGSWDAPEDVWGSRDHTGEAVPMFAAGPGAEAFAGFGENTEVGKSLLSLVETMGR
jgi:alkaline phosphatase